MIQGGRRLAVAMMWCGGADTSPADLQPDDALSFSLSSDVRGCAMARQGAAGMNMMLTAPLQLERCHWPRQMQ